MLDMRCKFLKGGIRTKFIKMGLHVWDIMLLGIKLIRDNIFPYYRLKILSLCLTLEYFDFFNSSSFKKSLVREAQTRGAKTQKDEEDFKSNTQVFKFQNDLLFFVGLTKIGVVKH